MKQHIKNEKWRRISHIADNLSKIAWECKNDNIPYAKYDINQIVEIITELEEAEGGDSDGTNM